MKKILPMLLGIGMSLGANAQWAGPGIGTATITGTSAQLTSCPSTALSQGAAWMNAHPDFTQPFTVTFRAQFNATANGADGIALVFKSGSASTCCSSFDAASLTVNGNSGYLGYYHAPGSTQAAGFDHSLAIEFDIFSNGAGVYGDIPADHTMIALNGDWATAPLPAVQIDPANASVKDNAYHNYRVEWNCADSSITVFFDNQQRLHATGIDVSGITYPMVGFTAGVGSGINCATQTVDSASLVEHPESSCAGFASGDLRYWKVTGNNIVNGNNIFGTLTKDNVLVKTSGQSRGIMTLDGLLGWNTITPTAYLHVNCKGHNADDGSAGTSDVRFEQLEPGRGNMLVIDANGYVHDSKQVYTPGGISNSCGTLNLIPKVTSTGGNLGCSQVYDDGTSVGINKTTGFTYTWSGGLSGTTAPPASGTVKLDVNGVTRALAFMATSDERFKQNITPVTDPFSIINNLQGKTYYWNDEVRGKTGADAGKQYGFIAQEVAKVLPDAVITDEQGYYAINYNDFIPLLVEGNKELYKQNKELKDELAEVKSMLNDLRDCCSKNDGKTTAAAVTDYSNSILYQNTPNPYNKQTEISFFIAAMNQSAFITINDLNGRELQRFPVAQAGKGKVVVDGSDMVSGIYLYTLIVDGKEIDSKRMVLVK